MNDILGFVSFVEDTEKNSFLVNLAACLCAGGKRVLLLDLAHPAPALDILCGASEEVVYTAADVASGRVELSRALIPVRLQMGKIKTESHLFLLPGSPAEHLSQSDARTLLERVRRLDDMDMAIVLFSCENAVRDGADGLFLLSGADRSSLRATEALGTSFGADAFLLLAYPTDWDGMAFVSAPLSAMDRVGLPLLGIVPRLPSGLGSAFAVGRKRAQGYWQAVQNVTNRFLGNTTPLLKHVPLNGISRHRLLTKGE